MNTYQLRTSHFLAAAIGLGALVTVTSAPLRDGLVARVPSRVLNVSGEAAALMGAHLSWVVGYAVIAIIAAAALALAATWARPDGAAPPDHAVVLLLLAGMCWPVLCVGLIQLGILAALSFVPQQAAGPVVHSGCS